MAVRNPTRMAVKISFCTWIRNRLHQYRITSLRNLERARGYDVEFVVVDAGSTDGLVDWMAANLGGAIGDGTVRYETVSPDPFHFSRYKNVAHGLARGDILVNLDADNMIGPRFCEWALAALPGATTIAHPWSGAWGDGTCGRIALMRDAFDALGGYDEGMEPAGYQDIDLLRRAVASGVYVLEERHADVVGGALFNTIDEKMKFLPNADWSGMNKRNYARSVGRIASGFLRGERRY